MHSYKDLELAIRQREVRAIVRLMFESSFPQLRCGFKTENELWDFKNDCPKPTKENINAWCEIARHVLAFHNNKGGIIIFGINNDYSFSGVTIRLDSKLINDQLRKFLSDRIWVEFHREFIQPDQRYLGLALIPPRGPVIERFKTKAPEVNGRCLFRSNDSAIREGDSSRILTKEEADKFAHTVATPTLGKIYEVDEPFYRILSPEYIHFVRRDIPCKRIEEAIKDPRTAVASIVGIGGLGKTALATWAALRSYEKKDFEFIVAITAKDRELTSTGIQSLKPKLTSFESLLDGILEVLGFPDIKTKSIDPKKNEVMSLLKNSNGLLYVDNLETVDDTRIVTFLDNLPVGVRAIVTSRRSIVRTSVHPIDLGPLTDEEINEFISSLSSLSGLGYVANFSPAERKRIGESCNGIPLAIRWVLSRSKTELEALSNADSLTKAERRGEELLEFSFRRVFDQMLQEERTMIQVLSLFQKPLSTEAIIVGTKLSSFKFQAAADRLVDDALVQRIFDPDQNDYCYTLFPIVRSFVYLQVSKTPNLESDIRNTLTNWFEAIDVKDTDERLVIREIRQGKESSELALLDLAISAESRGDLQSAETLFKQALSRNQKSWKVAWKYAEFVRHKKRNTTEALRLYEQAAANAPRRGNERSRIFREWGMLLKDSGDPTSTDLAIEKFKIALIETPNDEYAIHALAHMLSRKGMYIPVIELLEPLLKHPKKITREKTLPLLLEAYKYNRDTINIERIKTEIEKLNEE